MTAVLAAVARAVLCAVLLLAVVAAVLWAQYGPQGWPMLAWLLAVCAVVVAAGLCASALQPRRVPAVDETPPDGRRVIDYDEKGFPCLGSDCPECSATALIINEWDAIECLSCSWREFGPDDARADFSKWPDEDYAIPGAWGDGDG